MARDYQEGWGWVNGPIPRWPTGPRHLRNPASHRQWLDERATNSVLHDSISGQLWFHAWSAFCQQWLAITLAAVIGRAESLHA